MSHEAIKAIAMHPYAADVKFFHAFFLIVLCACKIYTLSLSLSLSLSRDVSILTEILNLENLNLNLAK